MLNTTGYEFGDFEWNKAFNSNGLSVRESQPAGVLPFDAVTVLKCPCGGEVQVYARIAKNIACVTFEIRYQCALCRRGESSSFRGNRYDARRDWLKTLKAARGVVRVDEIEVPAEVVESAAGVYSLFMECGGRCSCGSLTTVERNGHYRARCEACGKTGSVTPHLAEALCGIG